MGIRGVPPGLDRNLDGFLRELRSAIGGMDTRITHVINSISGSSNGGSNSGGGTTPTSPTTPVEDCSKSPPAPTSLTATPASFSVTLQWSQPSDLSCYDVTEIWALRTFNAWNSTYIYSAGALVIVNGVVYKSRQVENKNHAVTDTTWWAATSLAPTDKAKVGEVAGTSWVHMGLTPGETWTYWIRNRNKGGLLSTWYPPDDVGVTTTTTLDPTAYLDLLTGAIHDTQLYKDLGARINLIDGPDTLVNSVNARVKSARDAADLAIGNLRDGVTDITILGDGAATTLRGLKTTTNTSAAAIVQLNTVDATSTSANVKALLGLKAQVNDPTTGLPAAQGYITQLNTINATSTSANVQTLLGLRTQVNDPVTGLPKAVANINEINNVSTTSTSAAASKIATLDAQVNTTTTGLAAQIAAVNDVSATSSSVNAKALFQVQASNSTKVSVFFQASAPSTSGRVAGDLWYDTSNNYKEYRWDGGQWAIYRSSVKTYSQTTAPTNNPVGTLYTGDIWIDTSLDASNNPKNTTYRWNGTGWVDVSHGLSVTESNALITNLENTKIGYCSIGGLTTDQTDRSSCEAAGGTWHAGLPMATAVKQVSVSTSGKCYINGALNTGYSQASCEAATGSDGKKGVWLPGGTAALEQKFQAVQDSTGPLYAQYTLKVDTNGWVSGFGLANTQQTDGTVVSDFGIRADRFWLAPPVNPGNAAGGPGIALVDISGNNTGVVVRIGSAVLTYGGAPTYFAYLQLADTPSNYGLNALNPFSGAATPQNRQWVSLTNIRDWLSGNKSTYWNQAWPAYGVGYFTWYDYNLGYSTSTSALPGVTNSNNVVVIASGIVSSTSQGYTTSVTDPTQANSDPAKLVPPNMLPFIVTSTSKVYNGVTVPAGVYINNAFMANAMIGRAIMTGAIGSDNFVAGSSGWQIDYQGNAEFNTVMVRTGNIQSNAVTDFSFVSFKNVGTAGTGYTYFPTGASDVQLQTYAGGKVVVNAIANAQYLTGTANTNAQGTFELIVNNVVVDPNAVTYVPVGSSGCVALTYSYPCNGSLDSFRLRYTALNAISVNVTGALQLILGKR